MMIRARHDTNIFQYFKWFHLNEVPIRLVQWYFYVSSEYNTDLGQIQ